MASIRTLLHFAVITDIHTACDNLTSFNQWLNGCKPSVDLILCCGDLANVYHDRARGTTEHDDVVRRRDGDEWIRVKESFKKFNLPVFYIPGNHDPASEFEEPSGIISMPLDGNSAILNMHKKVVTIINTEPLLAICALGGSTPAYYRDDNVRDKPVYSGYPYSDEHEIADDLKSLFQNIPKDSQIIWMSHVGPARCGTSTVQKLPSDRPIEAGSEAVSDRLDIICAVKSNIDLVCLLHGHTHHPWGHCKYRDASVINPGAMRDGRFVSMTLQSSGDKWKTSQISFHQLETPQ